MAQPVLKSPVYFLAFGVRELSSKILAHEGHACFEEVKRDLQGPRARLRGWRHGRIIPEGAAVYAVPWIGFQKQTKAGELGEADLDQVTGGVAQVGQHVKLQGPKAALGRENSIEGVWEQDLIDAVK
jgi:hypothetical protein